jgi:hypothetical protein
MWVMRREPSRMRMAWMITSIEPVIISRKVREGYDVLGEDANGRLIGRHRSTGIGRPRFWERARYYGEERALAAALDAAVAEGEAAS